MDNYAIVYLILSLLSLFWTQTVKFIAYSIIDHRLNFKMWTSTGGMPSSHSSLVSTITFSILFFEGVTASFVVSLVFAMVVVQDAMGVRYEASKHANIINQIVDDIEDPQKKEEIQEVNRGKDLKVMLGHKPKEAFGGVMFGILFAAIGFLIVRYGMGL